MLDYKKLKKEYPDSANYVNVIMATFDHYKDNNGKITQPTLTTIDDNGRQFNFITMMRTLGLFSQATLDKDSFGYWVAPTLKLIWLQHIDPKSIILRSTIWTYILQHDYEGWANGK